MSLRSSVHLADALRTIGLLTADQLSELPRLLNGPIADAASLAKKLLARGWLTVYQANRLLEEEGAHLVVGPYRVLDELGEGGQSQVFKARHADLNWIVALKIIRKKVLEQRGTAKRFLRELEAMAQLNHRNIVQFWDADQVGEDLYCAMEFVEGTDLGKCVRLTGPLRVAEASDYIRQTALGLQHAYEHNLIHRDIKPGNLFLVSGGVVSGDLANGGQAPAVPLGTQDASPTIYSAATIKILDWGLACLRPTRAESEACDRKLAPKAILGTADYISPEQADNAGAADIRSDLYSLGCTFYYLLTGQPPFPAGGRNQKLRQHREAEPTPVTELNPVVTAELGAIVRRLMAKRPEDRYQTPAAVALALTPFCRDLEPQSLVSRPQPTRLLSTVS